MLATHKEVFPIDLDLWHRRRAISTVKSEAMNDLAQFLALDFTA